MENQMDTRGETKETEIDLLKILIKTIVYFRKYWKLYLLVVILGVTLYFIPKPAPRRYYSSTMTVTTCLSGEDVKLVLSSLADAVKTGDVQAVADVFGLSVGSAKRIKKMYVLNIWDSTDVMVQPRVAIRKTKSKLIQIRIDLYNQEGKFNNKMTKLLLDSIRVGIVSYLNSNPYLKERYESSKVKTKNLIAEVENQIEKMDIIQQKLIAKKEIQSQVVVENVQQTSYSGDIIAFLEKKLQLQESYNLDKPLMVVQDFTVTKVVEPVVSRNQTLLLIFLIFLLTAGYTLYQEVKPFVPPMEKNKK